MFLLRPYTISGIAILLLQVYMVLYLYTMKDIDADKRRLNHAFALMWVLSSVVVLFVLLPVSIDRETLVDVYWARYLQHTTNILFFASCFHFIFEVLDIEGIKRREEWKSVQLGLGILFFIEVIYTVWRFWLTLQIGEIVQRRFWFQLPLLLAIWWLIITLIRMFILESQAETGMRITLPNLWHVFLRPPTRATALFRNLILSVFVVVILSLIYVSVTRLSGVPIWLANQSDITTILAILLALFAYLRYQEDMFGLELRVTSVGLALFLATNSLFGWIISSVFLGLEQPSVSIPSIIGSSSDPEFIIDPVLLPVLQRLHQLLLPVFWFLIIGSILFVIFFRFYFRTYEATAFRAILLGIEKLEAGDLSYRITGRWVGEFGRIANTFNVMAESLMTSNRALNEYQTELEKMVEIRSQRLVTEIEQRKEGELVIAIQEERARIARETHDSTLQGLLAVRMRLRSRRLKHAQPQVLSAELDELAAELLSSVNALRQIIHSSSLPHLKEGLSHAIDALIERSRKAYPFRIINSFDDNFDDLSQEKQVIILRFLQEGLSNAARHSQATEVSVGVEPAAKSPLVTFFVSDNGIGISPSSDSNGFGLQNMQTRAQKIGGEFTINANKPQGTTIKLTIPISAHSIE
jgi:signal transduction histidine kinase